MASPSKPTNNAAPGARPRIARPASQPTTDHAVLSSRCDSLLAGQRCARTAVSCSMNPSGSVALRTVARDARRLEVPGVVASAPSARPRVVNVPCSAFPVDAVVEAGELLPANVALPSRAVVDSIHLFIGPTAHAWIPHEFGEAHWRHTAISGVDAESSVGRLRAVSAPERAVASGLP